MVTRTCYSHEPLFIRRIRRETAATSNQHRYIFLKFADKLTKKFVTCIFEYPTKKLNPWVREGKNRVSCIFHFEVSCDSVAVALGCFRS